MSATDTDLTSSESALIPAHAPHTVSRRSMLGGLGLGSLAALVAPMFGLAPTAAADPRRPQDTPTPAPTGYAPVTPYLTQASCQLTEDYFLTDEVLIDLEGGDQIMPFTTQAGNVEAIVVTGSGTSRQVAHLARENATTSGWSYTVIDTGLSHVTSAAVYGTTGNQPQLLVSGLNGVQPRLVTLAFGAQGWAAASNVLAAPAALKSGIGPAGQFFYSWESSIDGPALTLTVTLYDAGHPGGVNVLTTPAIKSDYHYDDVVLRWDPQGRDGWIVVSIDGEVARSSQTGPTSYANPGGGIPVPTPNLDTLIGAYGSGPDVLWQDTAGQVNITMANQHVVGLGATAGSGSTSVGTWVTNEGYRFSFCLDDTISVISQLPPAPEAPFLFTPPIPMVPEVTRVFGVDTDPSASVLFAVDLDGSLSVLSYGPTGWTQDVVHQASATIQEITSWQCQITVTDANSIAVPAAAVQIGTDRPVALWQEGETSGSATTVQPGSPVTFTCDATGQLIVALPTNELDAAQLTAQALDSTGKPSGGPLAIGPDTDVQAFFAGTNGLDGIGMLTGDQLTAAQNTTWDTASQTYVDQGPLFPVIANLSGSQRTAAANAIAASINHVATLPTAAPAAAGDVRSACLDLTGSTITFATSSDPNHFTGSATGDPTWWAKAENDAKSFFHGLRHGGVHLAKLISSWGADAKSWTLNLVVTLEDDVQHLVSFIVTTAKEAIHAISSVIHALGADIEKAWHWLKNLVCGILATAEQGAQVMQSWIRQLTETTGPLMTALDSAEISADKFFTNLESDVDGWINGAITKAAKMTLGSAGPQNQPTDDTGSSNADINFTDTAKAIKVLTHCSPMYWLNKLKKHLPHRPADGGPSVSIDFSSIVTDLETEFTDAVDLVEAIVKTLSDALTAIFASKSSANGTPLAAIYQILQATESDTKTVVHDLLGFLDAVAVTVIDLVKAAVLALDGFFGYQFQAVPVIGGLLDHVGVDTKISIEHLICLVAAFPTAVIYRVMGYQGDMFPPQTDDHAAVRAWAKDVRTAAARKGHELGGSQWADPWGVALNLPSVAVQFAWASNDLVVNLGSENTLATCVGIAAPILMNIFGWPSKPYSSTLTGYPFRGGIDKTTKDWGIVPAIIIDEFVPPIASLVGIGLKKYGTAALSKTFEDQVTPWICTVAGFAGAVLGGTWSGVNKQGLGVAEAVIGNISYITGVAALPSAKENPYIVAGKAIADGIGDYTTAILYMVAFSQAADG